MKIVIVLALLCGTAAAEKIVIMTPPIAAACPQSASWPAVLECFKTHLLTATLTGTASDDAKLVAVAAKDSHRLEGYAIYVHTAAGPWRLGGLLQSQSGDLEDFAVLNFEHLGVHGYRVDIAAMTSIAVTLDGVTSIPAISHHVTSAFCSGGSYGCVEIMPICEQIVAGQTVTVFNGKATVKDNTITLTGVGSMPSCSGAATYQF